MSRTFRSAFTLIELLVVLAVVAVLSTVVVVTLNPAELIKQARDSTRISDLNTVNTALGTFAADSTSPFVGTSSIVYVSIPDSSPTCANLGLPALTGGWVYSCATVDNYKKIDGTGWIPANLNRLSFGNPLDKLPIDPKNSTSTGLYYTFVTTGTWWELTAILESDKYGPRMVIDGGASPNAFEQGTNLTLTPVVALDRGVSASSSVATISSISPTSTIVGGSGFTLTVVGSNFTSSSIVNWGASAKTTTFVSNTQLTASILAGDISATGTIAVTVSSSTPGGGSTAAQNFAITSSPIFGNGYAWTTDSSGGASQTFGANLVEVAGIFYVIPGNSTTFQKYDPTTKIWTTLAALPNIVAYGANLVKYNNDTLFTFRGAGTTDFYMYTISTNTWSTKAPAPNTTLSGAALTYPGTGEYIYATRGWIDTAFWRYSVTSDSWGESGVAQSYGASIAEAGGNYYVLTGNSSTTQKYNPTTKTWTTLAQLPNAIAYGASLVKYNSDTLFAFRGAGTTDFYMYTISTNTWSTKTAAPNTTLSGAALTYPGTGDYIYGLRGWYDTAFWRYSVSGNSWAVLTGAPFGPYAGGALISVGTDSIYAMQGNSGTGFAKYSIASSTWTSKAVTPSGVGSGGALTTDGTDIYATKGLGGGVFWKYTVGTNSWSTLTSVPVNVGSSDANARGGLAYVSSASTILAITGNSDGKTCSILEYNISNNTWQSCAAPWTIYSGGALVSVGTDNIYAFQANNQSGFAKYTISSGAWAIKAATPAPVWGGGSLTTDGTNIYATRGAATSTFWKYTIATDIWSALSDLPIGVGAADANARGGISYSQTLNAIYGISGNSTTIYRNGP